MATMNPEEVRFDADGWVVDNKGRVINTLHQYDRHPALAQRLLEKLT